VKHTRLMRYVDEIARTGSIRKAAERLNITPSALNRRIQDLEEELGTPIFERLARGVRLNSAGELFVRHVRTQISDLARVRSQIEDLAGFRRGNVAIACSQALAYHVLPTEIAEYRQRFPLVHFAVQMRDHREALAALANFEVDLALVFQPLPSPEFQTLGVFEQRLVAIMGADHPLATKSELRLRDCANFPLALPDRSYGGRALIDEALARHSVRIEPTIESNSFEFLRTYVRHESAITVQIEIGAPRIGKDKELGEEKDGLVARPIDSRDIRAGQLVLGQLRGRALPVAAAKFADDLVRRLEADALRAA
jgi:DNA-binding transcriptional LysR family regulator